MREEGIVLEVHGAEAVVQLTAGERSGPRCACAALGGENRHLQARTSLPVQVGERVVVEVHPGNTVLTAFLVFVLPLLGLAGGVVLGQSWRPLGLGRDAASIVLGFAALAALFGFAAFIDRLVRRKTALEPAIVEVLGPAAEAPAEACTTTNL